MYLFMKAYAIILADIVLSGINIQYLEYDSSMAKMYLYPLDPTGLEEPHKSMWTFWYKYPGSDGE